MDHRAVGRRLAEKRRKREASIARRPRESNRTPWALIALCALALVFIFSYFASQRERDQRASDAEAIRIERKLRDARSWDSR